MFCQLCGKKEATVHLTQVLNDDVRKLHLCEHCAKTSGIDIDAPVSVSNFLLGLGVPRKSPAGRERSCPKCGMRFPDFKKMARLGCQNCYAAFAEELEPLLIGMHKSGQHVGKKPACHAGMVNVPPSLASLEKTLKDAIQAENYEEAARIRDQLRELGADKAVNTKGKRLENS
jgi:protein arginine kinase activator